VKLVLIDALLQHSVIEFEHHLFIKAEAVTHFPDFSVDVGMVGLPYKIGIGRSQRIESISLHFLTETVSSTPSNFLFK
jgi:hypothetical protein